MVIVINGKDFLQDLASGEPVPGGGAAAALCGALSAALAEMAANLTLGKKKYEQRAAELTAASAQAKRLRLELERLMEDDASAFYQLSQIRKTPQTPENDTAGRSALIEDALEKASAAPLSIMAATAESVRLLECVEKIAAPGIKSDLGVGALFCRAALLGAALNVRVNAKMLKDRERAQVLAKKAESMDVFAERAEALYKRTLSLTI